MIAEARNDKKPVTIRMLQQWASAAALPFQSNNFHFIASESWIKKFKSTRKDCPTNCYTIQKIKK